jgi:hypothetical protein
MKKLSIYFLILFCLILFQGCKRATNSNPDETDSWTVFYVGTIKEIFFVENPDKRDLTKLKITFEDGKSFLIGRLVNFKDLNVGDKGILYMWKPYNYLTTLYANFYWEKIKLLEK